jgi:alpha-1,3-rhamnosyl/mannosyltransferase
MTMVGFDATRWADVNGIGRYTRELGRRLAQALGQRCLLVQGDVSPQLAPYLDWRVRDLMTHHWTVPQILWEAEVKLYHGTFMLPLINWRSHRNVVTIMDLMFEDHPGWYHPMTAAFFQAWVRESAARADAIVTPSQFVASRVADVWGIHATRIFTVPLGVDSQRFYARPDAESEAYVSKRLEHPRFVAGGGVHWRKNLRTILAAFDRMVQHNKHVRLTIFGAQQHRHPDDEEAIRQLTHEASQRIEWITPSDEALAQLYCDATALIYPTLGEGFGLPALEALSCGCPVIASNAEAVPEVVGDGGIYLTDPNDPEELALRCESLLNDYQHYRTLRISALAQSRRFSWELCTVNTLRVYEAILGKDLRDGTCSHSGTDMR